MCARYSLTAGEWEFFSSFLKELMLLKAAARFNIAPTQAAPVIVMNQAPEMRDLRFGFQTQASAARKASIVVNARSETVTEKPMFRDAFRERRCLVPATGFYEWRKSGIAKQPMNIRLKGGEPFYFAGLWRMGAASDGSEPEPGFVILTTEPNRLMASIHNRMPVILDREARDAWLDQSLGESDLLALLKSYPADAMEAWPVGSGVGSPHNDNPACLEPVEEAPRAIQGDLFGGI